ncbi:MerR family transcriptional regulator [Streptosporangium sp. DT93]|uniref:MerR family transcriptional regulator n=1 Tax=Streptosporangium sp. DT93 TaxID=3393428 RepID=UPI003CEF7273
MLSIGEFANVTGLGVKALHHYDEKGLLVPAEVDRGTRYRRYSEAQVRAGATVRALRDAGVPLPRIADALRDGDAEGVLARHRESVLARRAEEDAAHAAAGLVINAYEVPVEVTERRAGAQPYVAWALSVGVHDDDAAGSERANDRFRELFAALRRDGLGPAGPFWTTLREGGDPETVRVLCCWPTLKPVPAGWNVKGDGGDGDDGSGTGGGTAGSTVGSTLGNGEDIVVGELPARTELVASWRSADGAPPPEGSVHPAVIGLFEALADRGLDLRDAEIRQSTAGQDESDVTVEVAVTIAS